MVSVSHSEQGKGSPEGILQDGMDRAGEKAAGLSPRPTGVFPRTRPAGEGGQILLPPPPAPNLRTTGRRDEDCVAIESS